MRTGFDKAQAGDAKAKAAYEAAFGQKSDPTAVNHVIKNLETGKLTVDPSTTKFAGDQKNALAAVESIPIDVGGRIAVMHNPAQFSAGFHGTDASNPHLNLPDNANRALTMIHEQTHQKSNTGDYVSGDGKRINRLDDGVTERNGENGYSTHTTKYPFTVDDINKDTKYTGVRDKISNTHDNADAYSVFAGLCSTSLSRRDLELFSRALEEGDDEQLEDLMRRNPECKGQNSKKQAAVAKDAAKPAPGVKPVRTLSTDSSGSGKATSEVKPASPGRPVQKEVKPVQKEVKPVQKEVKPVQKEVKPVQKEVKPVQKEVKPVQKEVKPAQREAKPVTPSPSKAIPQLDKKSPAPAPAPQKAAAKLPAAVKK